MMLINRPFENIFRNDLLLRNEFLSLVTRRGIQRLEVCTGETFRPEQNCDWFYTILGGNNAQEYTYVIDTECGDFNACICRDCRGFVREQIEYYSLLRALQFIKENGLGRSVFLNFDSSSLYDDAMDGFTDYGIGRYRCPRLADIHKNLFQLLSEVRIDMRNDVPAKQYNKANRSVEGVQHETTTFPF